MISILRRPRSVQYVRWSRHVTSRHGDLLAVAARHFRALLRCGDALLALRASIYIATSAAASKTVHEQKHLDLRCRVGRRASHTRAEVGLLTRSMYVSPTCCCGCVYQSPMRRVRVSIIPFAFIQSGAALKLCMSFLASRQRLFRVTFIYRENVEVNDVSKEHSNHVTFYKIAHGPTSSRDQLCSSRAEPHPIASELQVNSAERCARRARPRYT